jgi:hypothetical protein
LEIGARTTVTSTRKLPMVLQAVTRVMVRCHDIPFIDGRP